MHFADQAQRQRKTVLAQALQAVVECCDVVGDFLDIVDRHAGRFVEFEQQQVRQR